MTTHNFIVLAKKIVWDWIANRYANEGKTIAINSHDVFVVWQSKILKNHKAILAAPTPDKFLFEVTYNGETGEFYLDAYDKLENRAYDGNLVLQYVDAVMADGKWG